MSNPLLLIVSCYGKVGYYPFFSLLSIILYNTSYLFILLDLINKRLYLISLTLVLNVCIFFRCSEYWLVLINLLIIISFIRSFSSIKHLLYISSYLLFITIYLLILLNNYLFSTLYLLIYLLLNYMILIKCCTLFDWRNNCIFIYFFGNFICCFLCYCFFLQFYSIVTLYFVI